MKKFEIICLLACFGLSCFSLGYITPDFVKSIKTKMRLRKLDKELKSLEEIIKWQEEHKQNEES